MFDAEVYVRTFWFVFLGLALLPDSAHCQETKVSARPDLRVASFLGSSEVQLTTGGNTTKLHPGERIGDWTFMEVVDAENKPRYAVVENFTRRDGHIVYVDTQGVQIDLPKSL